MQFFFSFVDWAYIGNPHCFNPQHIMKAFCFFQKYCNLQNKMILKGKKNLSKFIRVLFLNLFHLKGGIYKISIKYIKGFIFCFSLFFWLADWNSHILKSKKNKRFLNSFSNLFSSINWCHTGKMIQIGSNFDHSCSQRDRRISLLFLYFFNIRI